MSEGRAIGQQARELIEAHVTAAWLRYQLPDGSMTWGAGSFIDVMETGWGHLALSPIWGIRRPDGDRVDAWSKSWGRYPPDICHGTVEEWWQWELPYGWNDLHQADIDKFEDLGGGFDDHRVTFMSPGAHATKPAVPDAVVQAVAFLREMVE